MGVTDPSRRLPERDSPLRRVAVVVPAHDEEERIGDALRAIERSACRQPLTVEVVVVLDACTDRTAQVVRSRRPEGVERHVVTTSVRCAASARHVGFGYLERAARHDCAVLSTDADTVVAPDWIERHVAGLDAGLDALAGTVELDGRAGERLDLRRWRLDYERLFANDRRHPHVHAANLSVRLDVLRAVGGFGHRQRAEDIDLWDRLRRHPSVRIGSDHTLTVRTSHRLEGRVVGGFATALGRFDVSVPVATEPFPIT